MATIEDTIHSPVFHAGWTLNSGTKYRSLSEVLADRAQAFGDRRAYTFQGKDGDHVVTFGELDQRARAIGAALQSRVEPGERVLLLFHAGLDFISSFFGCLYAGALAVPTTYPKPRRPMPRLTGIAKNCEASLVLADSETLATLDETIMASDLPDMHWLAVDTIDNGAASDLQPVETHPDQLAFLQYTSGSTSEPKGVMVSHGNLLHNLEVIRIGFGLRSADEAGNVQTGVFWLPAYHDMGLIGGILESLYVGGHSVLMSPAAFLQRPIGWLETMSEYRAAISGAPNFAYELCVARATEEQRRRLDLSNWRVAFCGAEPIRPSTLHSFAEAFATSGFREESFYPCFGLAEATLLAAGSHGPHELFIRHVNRTQLANHKVEMVPAGDEDAQPLVGCGAALNGQEIAIVDPQTLARCPSDTVGEIWIKGDSVAGGYWGCEDETRQTFQATTADGQGPFLRTGDLGFFAESNLFVTGRLKDVMIIRGRNHYPQDVEKSAGDAHEALRQDSGAVFTVEEEGTEKLVVVQEVDRQYREADFDEVIRAIRRQVAEAHELEVHAVVLIRHASLPRTTSGKVQRHICREQFLTGDFKQLAVWKKQVPANGSNGKPSSDKSPTRLRQADRPMTPDEIDRLAERVESWLMTWLIERAAIPENEVHRNKPFAEYGLDSLTAVELSQELEDWLGVEVVPTVAWNYPTPATLSVYLAREAAGANEHEIEELASDAEPPDDEFARMLAEIESLSDEDARSLLDE